MKNMIIKIENVAEMIQNTWAIGNKQTTEQHIKRYDSRTLGKT